jgi:hypothetical protein
MQMLWLLQRSEGGAVRADYPDRVLPTAHRSRVELLLNDGRR